jgi:ATP-dependent Clp protease ATP-binding subunit ClpC
MFGRFTQRARRVMLLARQEAGRLNHDYIGTEHILLGLVRLGEGVAAVVLEKLGLNLETIKVGVDKLVTKGSATMMMGEVPYTPRAKRALELAVEEARSLGHNYIGTEHLLLGLIREGEGVAAQVLLNLGVDLETIRKKVIELLGGGTPRGGAPGVATKTTTPALDAFGRDLTRLARENKLDPVIGREDEIQRVVQILGRRTKNNPVLIGEPGVGKTAITEGLAQEISAGKVPEILANKRVIILDLAGMVAGTKYRGEFEERMKRAIEEIRRNKDIIIFIDELHTLVGAGAAEGAIDASSMLKPALSRGELQCIGATTLNDYRKYIEKDGALERRFQTIMVEPPTVPETIEILKGLRDKYEAHHRAKFTEEALVAAARLSDRYISDRYLPDKAIDLIDEAGSRARLAATTLPPDLKSIEKAIQEVDKEKMEAIKTQKFELAAKFRDKERELKTKLDQAKQERERSRKQKEPVVTEEDIAYIVSKWTGIPVVRLTEKETDRLLRMEGELAKRVVGQEEAIKAVSQAVRRARAGLKAPERPIGSFVFCGPTGVGKTELARTLADFLFGDENAMVRIDMSEFMEKFAVSRLIGAPPGYVGYEEGGQLSEQVRRKPYSVILLDEIEKAHPDVFNILLQVLDDGRLTDNLGHTVDFKNTVVIMTSNVGTSDIRKGGTLGFLAKGEDLSYEGVKEKVMTAMKKTFRPEFLNRLDEIIVFHPLDREDLLKIIDIMLEEVEARLGERDMKLKLTSSSKDFLIEKGYDPTFGARPLQRTIRRYIENPLSSKVLMGKFKEGDTIFAKVTNEMLIFTNEGKTKK